MNYSNKNGTINSVVTSGSLSDSYAANMPDAVTAQDNKNNQIINQINALKEQEIINARNAYAKNMSEYGANAAALSAMGLSGSGYGDYLNGKAYAAYRDDVQAANAKAQSSLISYQEGLNNKYLELLSELEQGGGGSVDYVTQLSDQLGFTGEQKNSLVKKAKYNEVMLGLESKTFGSASEIMNYINGYINSDADDSNNTKIKDAAISVIKANGFDSTGVTDDYMQKSLASSTVRSAKAIKYNSLNNGDDITVKVGEKEYTVESDGVSNNPSVLTYAQKNIREDGKVFAYGEDKDLYMYKDDKVYKIVSKFGNDKYNGQYNAVRQYIMTGQETTEK